MLVQLAKLLNNLVKLIQEAHPYGWVFLLSLSCYNLAMKYKRFLLIGSIIPILLSGCTKANSFIGGDLIFTEFYVGEVYANRAVEIANVGNKELDLSKYHISIFRDGGQEKAKPTDKIYLEGSLQPGETYVIAYSEAKEEIKAKANLISEDLLNDGTFPMTINNKKEQVIDYLGYPGYFYNLAQCGDAVRKVEKLSASTYNAYDWIRYPTSNLDNLGNLNCLDNKTIFKGPKLTTEDFNKPYAVNNSTAGGGAVKVSLNYTIDGDTTKFNFPSSLAEFGLSGSQSVRYYGINTPELPHGGNPADPYGPEARDFTNNIINSAKHFVVQSIEGYELTETYGRILAYVWVSFENNPEPSDYFLLNHYILQNGFARVGRIERGSYNDLMLYNGISYVEYFYDAQQYAISNKLHIYEEGL